jgi:endonuclease YncB( thermonuclease family)
MRSEDWIQGPVLLVLSGDTLEIQVTLVGRSNDFPYNARERIRIDTSAPSFNTLAGEEAKSQLEEWLLDKTVRCYVHARDLEGVLFCEVEVIDG